MEAHESIFQCVIEFALDIFFVNIRCNSIVNVEKSNRIVADNSSDKLTQCTIDINFAGNRDTHLCQTAVYIARNETKLCLECRPAFTGDRNELTVSFVILDPVKESDLILSKFLKDLRFLVACAKLCFHILNNIRDTSISGMVIECFKQVKLRVLFNFNIQVVKLLDRSITS